MGRRRRSSSSEGSSSSSSSSNGSSSASSSFSFDTTSKSVRETLREHDQLHLLSFYRELDDAGRQGLLSQLRRMDIGKALAARESALALEEESKNATLASGDGIEPLPSSSQLDLSHATRGEISSYRREGLGEISLGRVAVVLLAGGQGTRLGSSDPKGMYDIGLPSHTSLFQNQARRILRVQELARKQSEREKKRTEVKKDAKEKNGDGSESSSSSESSSGSSSSSESSSAPERPCVVPWYVMTSPQTSAATKKYFRDNKYLGVSRSNVTFFEQGTLPAFGNDGKILLEAPDRIATAPNGNGGIYEALHTSGVMDDLRKRGVVHVLVYSVDNALARVADPVFVGFMASQAADCGAKAVPRRSATEKVGVFALKNGLPSVVEYSEIGETRAAAMSPDGKSLLYNAGNICYHYYSTEFLERFGHADVFHVARKKIPTINEAGEAVKPTEPNGIKLETFIFDAFTTSRKFAVMLVPRSNEFSPVKNAPGSKEDSPDTARSDLAARAVHMITAAGGIVEDAEKAIAEGLLEVSPLVSYDGEGMSFVKGQTITPPLCIDQKLKRKMKKSSKN